LEGKKRKIIKNYELRIKNLEKNNGGGANNEALGKLRFELKNINQILTNSRVLSIGEKYANDVVELAKILGLPKIPERIEGYDIANIFGKEAVGSMTVFNGGEADKNEYRKFKIKIGPAFAEASAGKQGDVQMLRHILERRFNNDWPRPDLIVIDGGKAQLNAALRVLKQRKLEIPLIAISKGLGLRSSVAPDKLFFPGQIKPLELPLASPALHLIKRVRDEAHRFAIGYHRKLRSRVKFV